MTDKLEVTMAQPILIFLGIHIDTLNKWVINLSIAINIWGHIELNESNADMESWASIAHRRFVADCGRICGTTVNQGVKVHFLKTFHNVVFNAKQIWTFNLCF